MVLFFSFSLQGALSSNHAGNRQTNLFIFSKEYTPIKLRGLIIKTIKIETIKGKNYEGYVPPNALKRILKTENTRGGKKREKERRGVNEAEHPTEKFYYMMR